MSRLETRTRLPSAAPEQVLAAGGAVVVDLRSPAEFAQDHLPGAVNVPLFDDAERAVVGTLYCTRSPEEAFERGRELAEARVADLVAGIAAAAGWRPPGGDLAALVRRRTRGGIRGLERELVTERVRSPGPGAVYLYCWRGGLRSRSVTALLHELGLERATLVEGGYKAYRRAVIEGLEAWRAPRAYVLRGLTGVGKTLVLRELERLRPGWTVDLEALAGHRSSILGMVGLEPCTQKTFETRLLARIRQGFPPVAGGAPVVVFEGESRKVGDAVIPAGVWRPLAGGVGIELVASAGRRVQVLVEDYLAHPASRDELRGQLPFIEERLGPRRWRGVLVALLDGGRERELVETLLEQYYDPLYRHSERDYRYAVRVEAGDPSRAAREVASWVEERERDAGRL